MSKSQEGFIGLIPLVGLLAIISVGVGTYFLKPNIFQKDSMFNSNNFLSNNVPASSASNVAITKEESFKNCQRYGYGQNDEFLVNYVVKKGDSLTSIAKTELGDINRVDEIKVLNHLTGNDPVVPFIEIGWILYLPPKSVLRSNGDLSEVWGNIIEISGNDWRIQTGSNKYIQPVQIDSDTVLEKDFKVGDCVSVLKQHPYKVFSIKSQPENSENPNSLINEANLKDLETLAKKCPVNESSTKDGSSYAKDEFLMEYRVKPGDTLLNIAQNQLGSTSRINEILNLNQNAFPDLSIANPSLKVGAKLYLPPKKIAKSSGFIRLDSGSLIERDSKLNKWNVVLDLGYGTSFVAFTLKDSQIKDFKENYKTGDCVIVLTDQNTSELFEIKKQK